MTLEQERNKFAIKIAEHVYSKYMVDAYELRACNVIYDVNKLEKFKLKIDWSGYGLSCDKLNPNKKSILKIVADPMMPIVENDDILITSQECNYLHIQSTEAEVWSVVHNLGYNPNVTTVLVNSDGTETEVHGLVTYLDINTLRIEFNEPTSGKAYLS